MRTFFELREYMVKKRDSSELEFSKAPASFQVHASSTLQFNMSFGKNPAAIKFEERTTGIFAISTAFDGINFEINYAGTKNFALSDSITKLLDVFPSAPMIDEIVSVLLVLDKN